MSSVERIRHVGIVVRDLERALRFYRDILGFEITTRLSESGRYLETLLDLPGAKAVTVKLSVPQDAVMIELIAFESPATTACLPHPINTPGFTHISFTVTDLQKLYRRLLHENIRFAAPPQLSPDGCVKVCFCRDPEDNFLELVEVLNGKS